MENKANKKARKERRKKTIKNLLLKEFKDFQWTARLIANFLGMHNDYETKPQVRKLIRELISEGCPIGSNNTGYFWIKNRIQLEDCLEDLQSRCDALQKRIVDITYSYKMERASLHLDTHLFIKDRCRYFVIYIAEAAGIPYQAVWTMAYRKLQKLTGVDLVNLPAWYEGSVLNYCGNKNITWQLYAVLEHLERGLI